MKCTVCHKEFEGRVDAKFCSSACRKKSSRQKEDGTASVSRAEYQGTDSNTIFDSQGKTPNTVYKDGTPLTPTDQAREDKYPGYHNFDDEEYERECLNFKDCKTTFKTRLSMNKFCSEDCRP